MSEIEYLTDSNGNTKAVVIPMELWEKILPHPIRTTDELEEAVENYCLNKAMDEATETPILDLKAALEFLDD